MLPMQEFYHISILHNVFFSFRTDLPELAGFDKGARFEELLPINNLCADKFCFEVGMDSRSRFRCGRPAHNGPRAGLVFAGGKETNEPEGLVTGADKTVDAVLKHAALPPKLPLFVF